ncbi:hypothetical protein B0H63DRAFT_445092 [Podospora didyma]|uniref:Glycoside Hydrolase Family 16 n=1 Tax=Podospora didyma TaxID=330526 RepID=A0AAE0P7X1_9PEZI|nr:hypothetical protein B0H63DRAFT_445092 [Podospora didyma]
MVSLRLFVILFALFGFHVLGAIAAAGAPAAGAPAAGAPKPQQTGGTKPATAPAAGGKPTKPKPTKHQKNKKICNDQVNAELYDQDCNEVGSTDHMQLKKSSTLNVDYDGPSISNIKITPKKKGDGKSKFDSGSGEQSLPDDWTQLPDTQEWVSSQVFDCVTGQTSRDSPSLPPNLANQGVIMAYASTMAVWGLIAESDGWEEARIAYKPPNPYLMVSTTMHRLLLVIVLTIFAFAILRTTAVFQDYNIDYTNPTSTTTSLAISTSQPEPAVKAPKIGPGICTFQKQRGLCTLTLTLSENQSVMRADLYDNTCSPVGQLSSGLKFTGFWYTMPVVPTSQNPAIPKTTLQIKPAITRKFNRTRNQFESIDVSQFAFGDGWFIPNFFHPELDQRYLGVRLDSNKWDTWTSSIQFGCKSAMGNPRAVGGHHGREHAAGVVDAC